MENFNGVKIYEDSKGVSVTGVKDFDPVHTFACGQCFRWRPEEDKSFTGVAKGRVVNIGYDGETLRIKKIRPQRILKIYGLIIWT